MTVTINWTINYPSQFVNQQGKPVHIVIGCQFPRLGIPILQVR